MQDEAGQWQATRGCAKRQPGTGGVPLQRGPTAGGLDDRGKIVELPFPRVRRSVAAGAPPTSIDVQYRGEAAEGQRERTRPVPVAEDATDNDERRPVSEPIEGDGRAVRGRDDER